MFEIQDVIELAIIDLEAAEAKLEMLSMELCDSPSKLGCAFSGSISAYEQLLREVRAQLTVTASDIGRGELTSDLSRMKTLGTEFNL